jgi:excinuclease ABC subunit C
MTAQVFNDAGELPEAVGIYILQNENGQSLFVGAAENLKRDVRKVLARNARLKSETAHIELFENFDAQNVAANDLIKLYAQTVRREKPLYNFSLSKQNLYPHFKITNEKFPRLRVTRRIREDEADYFGAFLPETGARFLLGFINRMFRPRGCDIPIDGSFLVPCPEFYRKRCVAPCVENLCGEKDYRETIDLLRRFLSGENEKLTEKIFDKIQSAVDRLDFERAAKWRDFSQTIDDFTNDKDRQYRLNEAVDSFEIEQAAGKFLVRLVTNRRRKTLGRRTFVFKNDFGFSAKELLTQTLWQLYEFYAPKEIVVPNDFPQRKFLETQFKKRGARDSFKINVLKKDGRKITVKRALRLTEFEFEQENLKPETSLENIQNEFQIEFGLTNKPNRIEAFDVAHISGTDFVGAKSVWERGKFVAEEYEFWLLDERNEPGALAKTVANRFLNRAKLPDLILIDGGKSQLQAALKQVRQAADAAEITVVSAVKPPHRHGEIARFLFADGGRKVEFKKHLQTFKILLKLRDEAHNLANYVHRTKRETAHFYETDRILPTLSITKRRQLLKKFGSLGALKNASEKELIEFSGADKGASIYKDLQGENKKIEPPIVPIRFDDPNGAATDLQPLNLPETFYRKTRA